MARDNGWEIRLCLSADAGGAEFGSPPSSIRSEVEFEVSTRCGICEKELRDIVFPQPFREGTRFRAGATGGRCLPCGNEP